MTSRKSGALGKRYYKGGDMMSKTIESYTVKRTVVNFPIEEFDGEIYGGTITFEECLETNSAAIFTDGCFYHISDEEFDLSDSDQKDRFEAIKKKYLD